MKKGKVTELEIACLKGMLDINAEVTAMAEQLGRSVASIAKTVDRIRQESVRAQLFINKTAGGQEGISVMTEAASVRGDSASNQETSEPPTRSPWIHKIRSDG